MRFASSMRNASLSIITGSLLFAGAAMAQGVDLAGVNARLDKTLNSKNAAPGEMISAKLDGKVKTPEGVTLPKGSELMGKVDQAQPAANGGPAKVSIVFNQARLKDGKDVPVKVVLLGIYPADQAMAAQYGDSTMASAPRHINPGEKIDQEASQVGNVSMMSSAEGHDSGTLMKKDGDFKVPAGTFLQIGIAPKDYGASGSNNAE